MRPLDSICSIFDFFTSDILDLLQKRGIYTVNEFLRSDNRYLVRISSLTYQEISEVRKYITKSFSATPLNALKYYQKIKSHSALIPTGISDLDDLLHGGLFTGTIYEVCCSPGFEKTFFISTLLQNVVADNIIFFLDPKQEFSGKYMKMLLNKFKEKNVIYSLDRYGIMFKTTGVIPTRFLVLIAHFTICVNLLWSSNEILKSCLMVNLSEPEIKNHHTKVVVGLGVAIGLIIFEFFVFICGFTMFNNTSGLISIFTHTMASLTLCLLFVEKWQCGWFWWIFTFGSILPILYDVPDISVEYPGWTKLLFLAGLITVLGSSTPVGYNIGVINNPGYIIKQFCNESAYARSGLLLDNNQLEILWSSIVSIFLIGGTVGSLSGSYLADRIGRKGGLAISSVFGVIAGILFWTAKSANSIEMLFIGRIFGGLSAGLITTIMPMYLMECAPPRLKGSTGALCPLGVTSGILLGQILSMYKVLGNENDWPHCLAISAILQASCALVIPVLPESPKYLFVIKKQPQLALKELKRIRNVNEESLTDEMEVLRLENQENIRQGDTWNIIKVLRNKSLLLPLLLVCTLQAGQQLSGVNAVFYYSSSIFLSTGLSTSSSELATIGAGCCNIFMAIVSIQTMSYFRRRTILQISLLSSTCFLILLGISISYMGTYQWMSYLCIVGVLGYVLCYGLGLGPIPYFIGSELFEVGPRSSAMALGSMANWAGNFIVGLTFPMMATYIGAASFFIFAVIAVAIFIFIRVYLPETKGNDTCEISHLVENGFRSRPLMTQTVLPNTNYELKNLNEKMSP